MTLAEAELKMSQIDARIAELKLEMIKIEIEGLKKELAYARRLQELAEGLARSLPRLIVYNAPNPVVR